MVEIFPRLLKGWRLPFVLTLLVLVTLGVAAWRVFSDKLIVSSTGSGVNIRTLWLGEYGIPVSSLFIYEGDSGKEAVRFVAKNGDAGMHTIPVHPGVNQFEDMHYLTDYSISYPSGKPYSFKSGIPYKVVVRWKYRSSARSFVLP